MMKWIVSEDRNGDQEPLGEAPDLNSVKAIIEDYIRESPRSPSPSLRSGDSF
jgi:hypothetical protein